MARKGEDYSDYPSRLLYRCNRRLYVCLIFKGISILLKNGDCKESYPKLRQEKIDFLKDDIVRGVAFY